MFQICRCAGRHAPRPRGTYARSGATPPQHGRARGVQRDRPARGAAARVRIRTWGERVRAGGNAGRRQNAPQGPTLPASPLRGSQPSPGLNHRRTCASVKTHTYAGSYNDAFPGGDPCRNVACGAQPHNFGVQCSKNLQVGHLPTWGGPQLCRRPFGQERRTYGIDSWNQSVNRGHSQP